MLDGIAIALRFATYSILSLAAGAPLFLHLALGTRHAREILAGVRIPHGLLLLSAAALSFLGLLLASAMMAGVPLFPVDWTTVDLILSVTPSGKAIAARIAILLTMIPLAMTGAVRTCLLCGIAAAATLAWSGHGAGSEGMAGWLHLIADIVHLVAAALWIGGMACLLLVLRRRQEALSLPMLHAFAPIGSVTVALLIVTGIVNGATIVGIPTLPDLLGTRYGQLLLIKLAAFCAMLLLAANNRLRLAPAFERDAGVARLPLTRAVQAEIALAFLILLLVGWLGMIDPAATA